MSRLVLILTLFPASLLIGLLLFLLAPLQFTSHHGTRNLFLKHIPDANPFISPHPHPLTLKQTIQTLSQQDMGSITTYEALHCSAILDLITPIAEFPFQISHALVYTRTAARAPRKIFTFLVPLPFAYLTHSHTSFSSWLLKLPHLRILTSPVTAHTPDKIRLPH